MTLAQFAIAVGAGTKWVQNATAALGQPIEYGVEEARRLGLARTIQSLAGTTVPRAVEIAGRALSSADPVFTVESADGSVELSVDVERYLSTFGARLALARREQPQRRGRPARREKDPIAAAREYGIDISLIKSNLTRTPEERLRNAGENAELVRRIREARR